MMRKTTQVMMALLLSQSILANAATHPVGMSVLKTIWQYAQAGDRVALEKLAQQGVSLDSSDAKGNTVLCASVLLNNKVAYNTLIAAGADADTSCMNKISKAQKEKFCLNKGLLNKTLCETKDGGGLIFDSVWAEVAGVALIGGAAAAAGGGGGGGGSSSSSGDSGSGSGGDNTGGDSGATGGDNGGSSGDNGGSGGGNDEPNVPETPIPDDKKTMPVATVGSCVDGEIINGVCTKVITPGADGSEAISYTAEDENESTMMLAEFGGSVSNSSEITSKGHNDAQKVVMWANGVGAGAVSEDGQEVDLSKAASATNAGTISISEEENNKGVVAMKATSGGTINNSGNIEVVSASESQSAAMLAEGQGSRIESTGSISLTATGKTGALSGIDAGDRQVVNKGTVDITLGEGTQTDGKVATVKGLYGADVYNNGTIKIAVADKTTDENATQTPNVSLDTTLNLMTDDATEKTPVEKIDNPIRSNVFAMGASPKGTIVNNGMIDVDLTGMSYGVYGMYADASSGATLTNNKNINFTGKLENDGKIGKQVFVMGSKGGSANTTNKGSIKVDVDASKGGYLSVMDGFNGSLTNEGKIDFTIKSDRQTSTPFSISALSMSSGSATNKGTIKAVLTGSAVGGSSLYAFRPTGYADVSSTNSGTIDISSNIDNFDLVALAVGRKKAYNDQNGKIYLTTSGNNANLYGAKLAILDGSDSEGGKNAGHIVLTHNGGSGEIRGFGGGNDGIIDIYANDMVGESTILGVGSSGGDESSADGNKININLTGATYGNVTGFRFESETDTWSDDNEINVNAVSSTRTGDLDVKGFLVNGSIIRVDNKGPNGENLWRYSVPVAFSEKERITIKADGVDGKKLHATGMKGVDGSINLESGSVISIDSKLKDTDNYLLVGMESFSSLGVLEGRVMEDNQLKRVETFVKAINNGTIEINATGTSGTTNEDSIKFGGNFGVIGMLTNSYAKNVGKINITASENIRAVGMLAYDGGIIENAGTITFNGNADNFIAMYAGNDGVVHATNYKPVVYNTGSIIINNKNDNYSYAGVGKLGEETDQDENKWRDGILLDFNRPLVQINQGTDYVSEKTGEFLAEGTTLSGDVIAGTSVVQGDNKDVYVASGSGEGALVGDGDWSNLGLSSASVLFNASYAHNAKNENGIDIVMTRRSFNEMTDNKSLGAFLEHNYMAGNNISFFNDLKSIGSMAAFSSAVSGLTGRETMLGFAREDLTAMREINVQMNDMMFANADKSIFTDSGTFDSFGFKNDDSSVAQYMMAGKRISSDLKVGYAMSVANLSTDDGDDTKRQNSLFQVFMPIGYTNGGWNMVSTPQIGYARGHYSRKGFNDMSYDGVIEKRIFALMNEARYPLKMGAFEVSPTVELNAIAYNTKGGEDDKAYALTMPSDNNVSVEAGVGIHTQYALNNLNLNAGLMMYREFANPYNIKIGMQGMDGTFNLYNDRSPYRGIASFGFGYDVGNLNIFGTLQHFMETDAYTKLKTGLKYQF